MGVPVVKIAAVFFSALVFSAGCSRPETINSWERHCEACHDGKTVLNGKVLLRGDEMKAKYRTLNEFVHACEGSGSCMNILKHQERLLQEVGKELGIGDASQKR